MAVVLNSMPLIVLVAVAVCVIQIFIAQKTPWFAGLILPVIYWTFSFSTIVDSLTPNAVQKIPDYYTAAALFFPGCFLLLLYLIFYYYWKCKSHTH